MNLNIILIFVLHMAYAYANIIFKAKFMGNWRVSGDSVVLHALSVSHCLAFCNKNASCDAITYHEKKNRCRLFKRCAPLRLAHKSTHHWFYAKRPPTNSSQYFYEEQSDSCLTIKNHTTTYEDVDNICAEDRAYPAVLNTPKLQLLADKILKEFGEDEAWINPPYKTSEKFASNREKQKKRKILYDKKKVELVSECWLFRHGKPEKISPCKPIYKLTICQLPTY